MRVSTSLNVRLLGTVGIIVALLFAVILGTL
jgi:hypothetical protein